MEGQFGTTALSERRLRRAGGGAPAACRAVTAPPHSSSTHNSDRPAQRATRSQPAPLDRSIDRAHSVPAARNTASQPTTHPCSLQQLTAQPPLTAPRAHAHRPLHCTRTHARTQRDPRNAQPLTHSLQRVARTSTRSSNSTTCSRCPLLRRIVAVSNNLSLTSSAARSATIDDSPSRCTRHPSSLTRPVRRQP